MADGGVSPHLFDGEVLDRVADFPCLYRFFAPASKEKPLVVFVPGRAHYARIFYGGHVGFHREDFPAYWLQKQGYGVLAISYPLEGKPAVMDVDASGFRISDWGRQSAEVTKMVVDHNQLTGDIVLVGWSMGGRIVIPFAKAAAVLGLHLKLFVSLSATAGIRGLRPAPLGIACTEAGYATFARMSDLFLTQIHEQEALNGSETIIPPDIYKAQYYGNTPVSMLGWDLKYDADTRGFVEDSLGSYEDAAAHQFSFLPWIAALYPTSQLDARHVLADKATWAFMLTQKLTAVIQSRMSPSGVNDQCWDELVALVHSAPTVLAKPITGNHYLFIGRKGARETAESIVKHLEHANDFQLKLDELLGMRSK